MGYSYEGEMDHVADTVTRAEHVLLFAHYGSVVCSCSPDRRFTVEEFNRHFAPAPARPYHDGIVEGCRRIDAHEIGECTP